MSAMQITPISQPAPTSLKTCPSFITVNMIGGGGFPLFIRERKIMMRCCFCLTYKRCIINTINNSTTTNWAASHCSAPLPAPALAWTSSTPMWQMVEVFTFPATRRQKECGGGAPHQLPMPLSQAIINIHQSIKYWLPCVNWELEWN